LVLEGRRRLRRWHKPEVTETNSYPWLTGLPADKVAAFNRYITQALKPAQSRYLNSDLKADPTAPGETVFERFYEIHRCDERLVSIEMFNHHEFNFGHGWRSEFVINWNFAHNRPLVIGDLFAPNQDWQRAISDEALKVAREDYDAKYAEEMISPAAVDSADVWLFDDDGATLMLGHGERSMVGAMIDVALPYDVFAPYLRPDAPLPGAGTK
jgi:hypothetical protein